MTKISIVIPTRERCQYLRHSVRTALEIDDDNIEIVVSDNASTDGTEQMIAEFDDPRLIYVNTGARLSMRENFNHAFLASSGEYLIYFGDDDGILPKQFPFLRDLIERHKPDGVSWNRATYGWPIEGFGKKTGGIRIFRDRIFGDARFYQGAENRENLLACRLGQMVPMPEIYHGCLSREFMIRTALHEDQIFDGAIPDYNLAYRSVLKSGRFVHANHTFSINGYSPASTGGGHNAAQSSKGGDSTSKLFGAENKIDPLQDVIGHAGSVPLAFFSTLETIRQRHDLLEFRPDYLAWYRYVLGSSRKNEELNAALVKVLLPHAKATDTVNDLNHARKLPFPPKRTWPEQFEKWKSYLHSLRVSSERDQQNTVLTAAHTLDTILGDGFSQAQSGNLPRKKAWAAAKQRAKAFQRQL